MISSEGKDLRQDVWKYGYIIITVKSIEIFGIKKRKGEHETLKNS